MTFIPYSGGPADEQCCSECEGDRRPNYTHTWADPALYTMADEEIIETSKNAVRKLCQIEKEPDPVLKPDQPWEGCEADGSATTLQDPFYATVLYDPSDELFKCWYRMFNRYLTRVYSPGFANQGSELAYAVSEDGINWEKPILGQVLYQGSYDNNMLRVINDSDAATDREGDGIGPVIPLAMPNSKDRFACSIHSRFDDPIYEKGITMSFSPDGINWRMHYPPVLPLDGDCHSVSIDPLNKQYIITSRSAAHAHLCQRWKHGWGRHIAIGVSRDLIHWTPLRTVIEADEQDPEDTQLYKMPVIPYGHAYIGYLLMFYSHTMTLETQLAVSRDLLNWQRVGDRIPILPKGPKGSWDSAHTTITDNPPHPEGDRMRFWYGGADAPHYQAGYGAMGTGTLRQDGFVCYEAGDKEAVLTTRPFVCKGATWLTVNVDAKGGKLEAEVIDEDGNPLEALSRKDCMAVKGDHVRALVRFKAGPGQFFDRGTFMRFYGKKVRYRFYMKNAKLYAIHSPNITFQWPDQKYWW